MKGRDVKTFLNVGRTNETFVGQWTVLFTCVYIYVYVYICIYTCLFYLNLLIFQITHLHVGSNFKFQKVLKGIQWKDSLPSLYPQLPSSTPCKETNVSTFWWIHPKICYTYTNKWVWMLPFPRTQTVAYYTLYLLFFLHSIACISFHINMAA